MTDFNKFGIVEKSIPQNVIPNLKHWENEINRSLKAKDSSVDLLKLLKI